MIHAQSDVAEMARTRSLDLLSQHLSAAIFLQDRMLQSPRHVRGDDFIAVDALCLGSAHLMEICAAEIAKRMTDLGGILLWPVPPRRFAPVFASDLPSPFKDADWPVIDAKPLEVFAQAVLDAAVFAESYGDGRTADLLARLWREIDCHLWTTCHLTPLGRSFPDSDPDEISTELNNLR